MGLASAMRRFFVSNELLEVSNQVVQLSDLDVVLNDITGVQEADSLDVLIDCFIVFLLLEKFVSMLFDNLTLDLPGEVGFLSDSLGLGVMGLLH